MYLLIHSAPPGYANPDGCIVRTKGGDTQCIWRQSTSWRAGEEQLAGEKAAVRTEVQHLLEKTRQDGQALLEQTKQEQRRLDRERQEQTKQEAARRREQTLKDAQAACDALRSSARLSEAAAEIVRRVVER